MLRFEEVAPGRKTQYLDLLLVGDEDPAMLQRYLGAGTLLRPLISRCRLALPWWWRSMRPR